MKIMIVDDEPIANFITVRLFRQIDKELEIIEHTDPMVAIDKISEIDPSYIFLDLNMPRMSGWLFLEEMKKKGLHHKVFILTSSISTFDQEKSLEYDNVVDCIEKPVKKEKLRECLAAA
jgi:CheY-like chemotaxis protein